MATNQDIDPTLLNDALKIGGQKSKKNTVTQALMEYIDKRKQKEILSMFGSVVYEPEYDYKKQRRNGVRERLFLVNLPSLKFL